MTWLTEKSSFFSVHAGSFFQLKPMISNIGTIFANIASQANASYAIVF